MVFSLFWLKEIKRGMGKDFLGSYTLFCEAEVLRIVQFYEEEFQ